MNYLLIIRLEIACLAILVYVLVNFLSVRRFSARAHNIYLCMLVVSMVNIAFDMITVYTVNHLDTVNPHLNVFLHVIFIGTLTALLYLVYLYIRELVFPDQKPFRALSLLPLVLSVGSVALLPLEYTKTPYGNYSSGPAAMVAYVCVAFYFLLSIVLLVRYRQRIEKRARLGIATSLACMIVVMLAQAVRGEILITSLGIALINLGFFFSLENADTLLAEQLAYEKERADAANRSKSDFLANMSHEIRTPINAVLGMNEMIMREAESSNVLAYANNVDSAGKNLLSIINDILDFSKIEAGRMEITEAPYALSSVLNDVCNMIIFRARSKDLTFEAEVDPKIPDMLMGDEVRVRQIITNLLTNAVKYTHEGGVTLSVSSDYVPGRATEKDAGKSAAGSLVLRVSVRDTGIGIREEDRKKLFSKFERVDLEKNKTIEGTGLGLAITGNLVRLMGGDVRVESRYGKGSVFSVTIPQKIVSEEPSMPGMDGTETLKHIRAQERGMNRTTPVICLTADAVQGARERYLAEGFSGYLSKPVESRALELTLMNHLPAEKVIRMATDVPQKTVPAVSQEAEGEGAAQAEHVSVADVFAAIPSLDYSAARQFLGTDELIEKTLRQFALSAAEKADEIEGFLASGDYENYTVKVHALKSSARMIGATALSEDAAHLEACGNNAR